MNSVCAALPSASQASEDLKCARQELSKFYSLTDRLGRRVCITGVSSCLKKVFTNGTPAEKQEATQLKASVDLEDAKLTWRDYGTNRCRPRNCISDVRTHLKNVLDKGVPAEKRAAIQLQASVDLEDAKLTWRDYGTNRCQPRNCISDVRTHLKNVLDEGVPEEKRAAIQLQASVDLEDAKLTWRDYGTSRRRPRDCISDVTRLLKNVLANGSPDEKGAAIRLQATAGLEDARLTWSDYSTNKREPRECISDISRLLKNVLENGVHAEKLEAIQLQAILDLELEKLNKINSAPDSI